MEKKRPDKFKRWMIVNLFLIPLVLFGVPLGFYYFYMPAKMKVVIHLFSYRRTQSWAYERINNEGENAVPYLIHSLSDKNPYIRTASLHMLISLGPQKGVDYDALLPQLKKLLSDPEDLVRGKAVWALAEIGSEEAVGLLIKSLSHPDWSFRIDVACALGGTGSKEAVGPLIKVLNETGVRLRQVAAGALGEIGSGEAVGPLIATLKEEPPPQTRAIEWNSFRRNVIEALEQITGQSFGDVEKATDAQRKEIIQKWLNWWEENKEKYEAEGEGTTKE